MKHYLYETHAHTKETSHCAHSPAIDLLRFLKEQGYYGVVITDHFYPKLQPGEQNWTDRINGHCAGYFAAKELSDQYGIDVLFGAEMSYEGADILTYGKMPEWFLSHPEIADMNLTEYLKFARSEGALLIHAHPFRMASYIPAIHLAPDLVDGVETCNARRKEIENERAKWYYDSYREQFNLLESYGSDFHIINFSLTTGVDFETPPKDEKEFVELMRERKYSCYKADVPSEKKIAPFYSDGESWNK